MDETIFEFRYDAGKKQPSYEERLGAIKVLYGDKISDFIDNFYQTPENQDKTVTLKLTSNDSGLEKKSEVDFLTKDNWDHSCCLE